MSRSTRTRSKVNYAAYFEPGSDDDPEEFSDASVPEDAASSDDFEPSPPVSRKVSDLNMWRGRPKKRGSAHRTKDAPHESLITAPARGHAPPGGN
jgi:hypothetical protein